MPLIHRKVRTDLAPWSALRDLEEHFNRAFNSPLTGTSAASAGWDPAADLSETDDAYIIDADIPGVAKDDIELEVLENVVTIRGERKSETEEKKKGYHHIERSFGSFRRSIEIPGGFDHEAVDATFEDGVLRVTLPKLEESKPRLITVKPN